jgi:outer membrane protein assembly factor BamA
MRLVSGKYIVFLNLISILIMLGPAFLSAEKSDAGVDSLIGKQDALWRTEREFPPEPLTPGKVLAAPFRIPEMLLRLVFLPLQIFVEYSEEVDLPHRAYDFFSNDDHTVFYYPTSTGSTLKFSSTDGLTLGAAYYDSKFLDMERKLMIKADVSTHEDFSGSVKYWRPAERANPYFYTLRLRYHRKGGEFFYGIGSDSKYSDESIYLEESGEVTLDIGRKLKSVRVLLPYLTVGYVSSRTSTTAKRGERSSIESLFNTDEIDGFGESIDFMIYGLTLRYDNRLPVSNPYQGHMMELSFLRGDSIGSSTYAFNRSHIGYSRVFDIYRRNRLLNVGFQVEYTAGFGNEVPFNYLSSLGKKSPLRGFSDGRFRDSGIVLFNMEYSYPVWRGFIPTVTGMGTVFLDLGQTFDKLEDLDAGNIQYSVGTGLAFTIAIKTYLRMQVGYGGESLKFVSAMSRSF